MKILKVRSATLLCLLLFPPVLLGQGDMRGSKDHPKVPRIEGSVIYGYSHSEYDNGFFLAKEDGAYSGVWPAGKRTQILYILPRSISRAAVWKNYGTAFESIGDIENIYNCVNSNCPSDIAHGAVWSEKNRIPTAIQGDEHLYQTGAYFNIRDYGYGYFTVTTPDTRYHVSIFSAEFTKKRYWILKPDVTETRSIHIQILEEADFEPTLKVVTSEEITKGITEKGKIALYGIHFDFDSDALKPDSNPALESIAAALKADTSLKIYVAGHTDNQGEYDYNMNLSRRRAASVVSALTQELEISADRLMAIGVGPVSPVASNRTEEGQALNRRVELVEK